MGSVPRWRYSWTLVEKKKLLPSTLPLLTFTKKNQGQNKKEKKGDSGHPYQLTEVFCNMAI